ncbi:MAG: DUF1858 domain-containing protein [Bacteroidetes bacterium]|jgi:hypothetical protein|nr:DUF1858 domain-containing protein [Bacteroidota bacterium]MBT4398788.1 DUF1858 domain-containing protein [Bacteroidota bacterium]MBT4412014.1 DUF1858 domain-containing protein [Bacteroidota bacterium]MBT7092365.1 DUF1858 domain-containing protein [Bacteroidota bacterium]MBT7465756.1 DUF1858 domain-containing protein [Bacteroidota bacterium]
MKLSGFWIVYMCTVYFAKNALSNYIMKITGKTYVSEILKEHGDIAGVMEIFGVKRVGGYGFRKVITRVITVKTAAFIHRIPLDKMLGMLENAIATK